jgi:NAD(P)-dependent dehydrogenase (short-subunit alcohol dehydrogenase family)
VCADIVERRASIRGKLAGAIDMAELNAFEGKLALVTGAGDGIGAMLAKGFAGAGLRVCVQDIRGDAAERVAADIGTQAFPLAFDVSDREAVFAAAAELERRGESINLLWLNAGGGVGAALLDARARVVEWGYGVNVLGVIWTAQALRPLLEAASGPRHVGITASSAALAAPSGDFPLYAATKHATFAVGEALREEFGRLGIGTTILCPGLLNTNIWDAAHERSRRAAAIWCAQPKATRRSVPYGRACAPSARRSWKSEARVNCR